ITQTSANDLTATTLCLESTTGSIGTSLAPILTNVVNLTANAANDVFVSDSGAVALADCGSLVNAAGGEYHLTAVGDITQTSANDLTATALCLESTTGSIGTSLAPILTNVVNLTA